MFPTALLLLALKQMVPITHIVVVAAISLLVYFFTATLPKSHRTRASEDGSYDVTLFYSKALRRPQVEQLNVTFVSHITSDRIPKAITWCTQWNGPMSLSFFVRPNETAAVVDAFVKDKCIAEHADVHVVEQSAKSKAEMVENGNMFAHYPFNVQRNAALDGVVGEWVFLTDIDFVEYPTEMRRERIFSRNYHKWRKTFPDPLKSLAIIPTVETVNDKVEHPTNHRALVEALDRHEVCAFYGHYCRECHLPTNVRRFAMNMQETYEVQYIPNFEPYVVVNKVGLPRYDERFIGRGFDKMSFFYELSVQQRAMIVIPGSYLVHTGRGDMPKNTTWQYWERQRENIILQGSFEYEKSLEYDVLYHPKEDKRFILESDSEQRALAPYQGVWNGVPIDWGLIQTTTGKSVCVATQRESVLPPNGLEAAIASACKIVNCTPLEMDPLKQLRWAARADWVFDRFYKNSSKCSFGQLAEVRNCTPGCFGCVARPTAMDQPLLAATAALCQSALMPDCGSVISALSYSNVTTVRSNATLVFSFFFATNRCTLDDEPRIVKQCHVGGNVAIRVPCHLMPI